MLIKILLTLLLVSVPVSVINAGETDSQNKVERGKQLVSQGKCNSCHTPLVETKDGLVPDTKRLLSGHPSDSEIPQAPDVEIDSDKWLEFLSTLDSTVWAGDWGISFAANLTPDPATGIGKWDKVTFVGIMRSGRHVDLRRDIKPPMPWKDYAKLSDDDLGAIYEYLATVPPVINPVPRPLPLPKND